MSKNSHSKVIWFTGLSGSGKTTLATVVLKKLTRYGFKVKKIDGDSFRKKTNNKNKFSKKNIIQNNNLIINYINRKKYNYDFLIVSVISPLRTTRLKAKRKFKKNYYEIYTKCSLKTLVKRDTKGLYKKAKKGILKNLIGFNSKIVYERSHYKKIIVNTKALSKINCVNKILKKII